MAGFAEAKKPRHPMSKARISSFPGSFVFITSAMRFPSVSRHCAQNLGLLAGGQFSEPRLDDDALAVDQREHRRHRDADGPERYLPHVIDVDAEAMQVVSGLADLLRQDGNQTDATVASRLADQSLIERRALGAIEALLLERYH